MSIIATPKEISEQELQPKADWQTRSRGSDEQEYEIYKAAAESLGWPIKSFEEWLRS